MPKDSRGRRTTHESRPNTTLLARPPTIINPVAIGPHTQSTRPRSSLRPRKPASRKLPSRRCTGTPSVHRGLSAPSRVRSHAAERGRGARARARAPGARAWVSTFLPASMCCVDTKARVRPPLRLSKNTGSRPPSLRCACSSYPPVSPSRVSHLSLASILLRGRTQVRALDELAHLHECATYAH